MALSAEATLLAGGAAKTVNNARRAAWPETGGTGAVVVTAPKQVICVAQPGVVRNAHVCLAVKLISAGGLGGPGLAWAMGSVLGGCAAVAGAESPVHDLAGQVKDCGVVAQDEAGVGGQDDPVQLEG